MYRKVRGKLAGLKKIVDYTRLAYLREMVRSVNRKNAVFIWIPKTAGTSLFSILNAPKLKNLHRLKYRFTGKGVVTFGHMDYARLIKEGYVSPSFDASAFKFAIVRNPYARAVSLYSYLKRVGKLPTEQTFLTFCRGLRDEGCEPIGLFNTRLLSQCNPQVRWTENVEIQFIGKLESLDEATRTILDRLELPNVQVPQLNKSKHPTYPSVYCSESKEIVETFYKEDFLAFGYDFEDFPTQAP